MKFFYKQRADSLWILFQEDFFFLSYIHALILKFKK